MGVAAEFLTDLFSVPFDHIEYHGGPYGAPFVSKFVMLFSRPAIIFERCKGNFHAMMILSSSNISSDGH